jgi:hypothetical protein
MAKSDATSFERVLMNLQEDGAISAHVGFWNDGTPYVEFSTCRGSCGQALLTWYWLPRQQFTERKINNELK